MSVDFSRESNSLDMMRGELKLGTFLLSVGVAALLATGVLLSGGSAMAQIIPTPVDPSILIQQLELEEPEPQAGGEMITLPEGEQPALEGGGDKLFVLRQIVLDGSGVYGPEDIQPILEQYIGQEVSLADLNIIARALTLKYRQDGYVMSLVVVPPQEIVDGVAHLRAVEGQITEIEIVGDVPDKNGLINRMAQRIRAAGPSNTAVLERYLLLIDDLPGIRARSVLQPSEVEGGAKLVVTIEQTPIVASVAFDNRGSRVIGPYRGTGVVAVNSMFGHHGRTTLRGIITAFSGQTRELRFADAMQEIQVGSNGLRLRARGAITATQPGGPAAPARVVGRSMSGQLRALYPLLRSRQQNINLLAGFNLLDAKSRIFGITVTRDRVRSVWVGVSGDFTDPFGGVTQVGADVTQGVNVFNATGGGLGRSRANGEHEFFRANLRATRIQDLSHGFSARLDATGQIAADPLLASEEISFGGGRFLRAFDAGEIAGDEGVGGEIELRYGGATSNDFVKTYQVYGYFDAARVWNQRAPFGEAKRLTRLSVGAGVRFNLAHGFSGVVEAGLPLNRAPAAEDGKDPRVFFSLIKRF